MKTEGPLSRIPRELDLPAEFGFTMQGWDFDSQAVRAAVLEHRMLNPAMELGTNICPWNCDFCFTESPDNRDGRKRRLSHELPIDRRLHLIDEAAALGTKSINFVGAGEPTVDPNFWLLVERMAARAITPIIYTEGSLRLKSRHFAQRLFDLDATIVLKMNSLSNPHYQDAVLRGIRPKAGVPRANYSEERKKALDVLVDVGFNAAVPTRLAFDTIICRENLGEIEDLHRYARMNNIFVLLVNYLPSGRTKDGHTSAISWTEQQAVFSQLARIDDVEFGIRHRAHFPYAGGVPCTIRGLGLFVKLQGDVFDCPGESSLLGSVREESLETIWKRARKITNQYDGGCLPRQLFWQRMAKQAELCQQSETAE
jgi:MoaA/NifB/PqqE/SkfB family radical SAM enzyme